MFVSPHVEQYDFEDPRGVVDIALQPMHTTTSNAPTPRTTSQRKMEHLSDSSTA